MSGIRSHPLARQPKVDEELLHDAALAIDPKHRGAHEYIGEAYLTLDDLAKAKTHLARLDSFCFLPCSEYSDLKKSVEAYEKSGGKVKPTAAR